MLADMGLLWEVQRGWLRAEDLLVIEEAGVVWIER